MDALDESDSEESSSDDDENEFDNAATTETAAAAAATAAAESVGVCVYVGGHSFDAEEADVRAFFNDCGTINAVRVPRYPRPPHKKKGFAFVEFASSAAAAAAVAKNGETMMNRWLQVRSANAISCCTFYVVQRYVTPFRVAPECAHKSHDRRATYVYANVTLQISITNDGGAARNNDALVDDAQGERPDGCRTIFVGNLAWTATDDDVRQAFTDCGDVVDCRVAMDADTQVRSATLGDAIIDFGGFFNLHSHFVLFVLLFCCC
jgi:nucleolin